MKEIVMIRLGVGKKKPHKQKQLFLSDTTDKRSSVWKSNCIWTLLTLGKNRALWVEMREMSFLALSRRYYL